MANSEDNLPRRKKRKKKQKNFGFLYLFAIVFLGAVFLLSNLIKSYSPDIDVSIGTSEPVTLSDSEIDVEIKSVDERLKWIQMEDDMPSVSIKESEMKNNQIKDFDDIVETPKPIKENSVVKTPPKPEMSEIKTASENTVKAVIPKPVPSVTKVYLGAYPNIEAAMTVQNKIGSEEPDLMPFVKAQNDKYIVQLGSFSDPEKAASLVNKLRANGYYPKTLIEN